MAMFYSERVCGNGREFQVESDGRTVWVNGDDGCNVGRFSAQGIDIHHDAESQMRGGKQCLDCKAGPCTDADFEYFRVGMRAVYGIEIDPRHMPLAMRSKEAA